MEESQIKKGNTEGREVYNRFQMLDHNSATLEILRILNDFFTVKHIDFNWLYHNVFTSIIYP